MGAAVAAREGSDAGARADRQMYVNLLVDQVA